MVRINFTPRGLTVGTEILPDSLAYHSSPSPMLLRISLSANIQPIFGRSSLAARFSFVPDEDKDDLFPMFFYVGGIEFINHQNSKEDAYSKSSGLISTRTIRLKGRLSKDEFPDTAVLMMNVGGNWKVYSFQLQGWFNTLLGGSIDFLVNPYFLSGQFHVGALGHVGNIGSLEKVGEFQEKPDLARIERMVQVKSDSKRTNRVDPRGVSLELKEAIVEEDIERLGIRYNAILDREKVLMPTVVKHGLLEYYGTISEEVALKKLREDTYVNLPGGRDMHVLFDGQRRTRELREAASSDLAKGFLKAARMMGQ
jgi:hypothetical protein